MSEETIALISVGLAIIAAIGGMFAWGLKRIDKRFEAVDNRFEQQDTYMREEFSSVRTVLKDLTDHVSTLDVRIARIEGTQNRFLLHP